jgi:uncharacterized membrane protein YgcG
VDLVTKKQREEQLEERRSERSESNKHRKLARANDRRSQHLRVLEESRQEVVSLAGENQRLQNLLQAEQRIARKTKVEMGEAMQRQRRILQEQQQDAQQAVEREQRLLSSLQNERRSENDVIQRKRALLEQKKQRAGERRGRHQQLLERVQEQCDGLRIECRQLRAERTVGKVAAATVATVVLEASLRCVCRDMAARVEGVLVEQKQRFCLQLTERERGEQQRLHDALLSQRQTMGQQRLDAVRHALRVQEEVAKRGANVAAAQRQALVDLFHATRGDQWGCNEHWLSERPIAEWYGVTAVVLEDASSSGSGGSGGSSGSSGSSSGAGSQNVLSSSTPADEHSEPRVTQLKLQKNNLNGYIPESIGSLDALTHLWADGNSITGQLPRNISSCKALVSSLALPPIHSAPLPLSSLSMHAPQPLLTTALLPPHLPPPSAYPSSLSQTSIRLFNNQLDGPIPESLGQCKGLQWIALSSNKLQGRVPVSLLELERLSYFYVNNNELEGVDRTELIFREKFGSGLKLLL